MKTKPVYLVIDTRAARPAVVRSRQSWPQLEPGEIVVRLALVIPDDLLPNVQEIVLENIEAMGLAIEEEPIEPEEVDV